MCIRDRCLFADDLGHQLFFRHIGIGIIVKVMGTFHSVAAQSIEQFLAAFLVAHTDGIDPVSYTHLDVYKRQLPIKAAKASLDTTYAVGETSTENDPAGEAVPEPVSYTHLDVYKRQA